ncbi:hypothetical protein [Adlercreutzia sp. ZJ138]|uniref:hypothetical protein n=1 Tax=Adlercreutzia sp. ZJ138 TaxID=2709405 RepID=UPI0013ED854D|nr:hypothetical protein [Adlercreutzia sp. ZJ138]
MTMTKMTRAMARNWINDIPAWYEFYNLDDEEITDDAIASHEEMREEAYQRLRMLELLEVLPEGCAESFQNDGENSLCLSKANGFMSTLCRVDDDEPTWNDTPVKDIIKRAQNRYGVQVYHALLFQASDGSGYTFDMLYMLYVGQHKEDWQYDRQDLLNAAPTAFVPVIGMPTSFDLGSVVIARGIGSIMPILDKPAKPFI